MVPADLVRLVPDHPVWKNWRKCTELIFLPSKMNLSNQTLTLLFLLFSIIIRCPSFFPTVLDHDESTYIIISDQLLNGKVPYVDNLDVKPIGIYLIFAAVLKFFNSILAIRLLSAIVISFSGLLIYQIHYILFSHRRVAIVSGFLYIAFASAHKWSWPSNTEIYFQCISLVALAMLLNARKPAQFLGFGFVCGLGFLVKFHIAFDIVAFTIFYFFWRGLDWKSWLKEMIIAFLGFIIPLTLLFFSYNLSGHLAELKFAMFTIPSGYSSDFTVARLFKFLAEFYLSFLPIVILLILGLGLAYQKQWLMKSHWILFVIWTVMTWIGVASTGKFFFHYYFQLLPPLCLFALTWFMFDYNNRWKGLKSFLIRNIYWIFAALILLSWSNQYWQVIRKPDVTRLIVDQLREQWMPDDLIYTSDKNILYYLLDVPPPTRFIHTTVLYNSELIRAYQVDVEKEFQSIVEQHMNYYVLLKESHPIIEKDVRENFELIQVYPGEVRLYGRIED